MSKYKWKKAWKYCEPTEDPRIFQSDWLYLHGVVTPVKHFYASVEDENIKINTYEHTIISPYLANDEDTKHKQAIQGLKEMIRICDYFEEHGNWEQGMERKPKKEYYYKEEMGATVPKTQ